MSCLSSSSRRVVGALIWAVLASQAVWAADVAQTASVAKQSPRVSPASRPVVTVGGAWIRPAVAGQSGTGGYMTLTSSQTVSLTGFSTPVASMSELHEMKMDGDVMRMGAIEALPLPAGQAVSLQPGGHHLMLMGLKQALKGGDQVPLTLILRTPQGQTVRQLINVPVRAH